jgi:hypothetical protein
MKKIFKPTWLPLFTLLAGAAGFGLRLWLLQSGIDHKGLLMADHPAGDLTFILTGIVLAVLALCVRTLMPMSNYRKLFPGRLIAGIGCVAAAAGILYVDIRDLLAQSDIITIVTTGLGVVAAACLLVLGWFRWKGKRPAFWLYSAVTIYFMLHLISQYRLWSSESQLQIYFFPLMASVFLMLTAYHNAVLAEQKNGSRRFYVFCNQAGLFFCFLSLHGTSWPFYLTMAVWLATGLCSLQPGKAISAESEES